MERSNLEARLTQYLASIPTAPRSAFQMFAQDQLDQLERQGPLPPDLDAAKMQQQFVSDYNALDLDQQRGYAARGQEQFQELLQQAREGLSEVCLPLRCACSAHACIGAASVPLPARMCTRAHAQERMHPVDATAPALCTACMPRVLLAAHCRS